MDDTTVQVATTPANTTATTTSNNSSNATTATTSNNSSNATTTTTTNNNSSNKFDKNNVRKTNGGNPISKTATVAPPPDGGWGWIVVMSSFFISVLVDGVCFTFGIFFNDFMYEFGTSKATTSWIGSVLNGAYLIFGPIVSALVNMYGCRRVAVAGAALSSVSFLVSTFSPNIGLFIFTYGFLGGVGFGLMYLPAIVMVGYYFEKRRALATGIACCGSGIGAFLFAPFTEFLLHEYGWRRGTWLLAALVGNGAVCALFYRPLVAQAPGSRPGARHAAGDQEEMVKLLASPCKDGREMIDMAEHRPDRSDQGPEKKRGVTELASPPVSGVLKSRVRQHLASSSSFSSPGDPPVFRTRSMTIDTSLITERETNSPQLVSSDTARLAFSQDLSLHQRKRHTGLQYNPAHRADVPPLQRKDIFYSGSLWHLKEYSETDSAEEYRVRVVDTVDSSDQETKAVRSSFVQSFVSVFDLSLLRSPTFLIYGASCFLCMAGFFIPFNYMPTHAMDMGLDSTSAAFLISIIGITNTISRVLVGFISDQSWADCLIINNLSLIAGGVATLFVPFYNQYYQLCIYSCIFGTAIAVFVSLRSIIMVELMGLERLTTAFGFVIMCQGLSSLIGPPVAGALSDATGNYNAAFYMAGITLSLSGIICLPLRRIARWETSKQNVAADGKNSGTHVDHVTLGTNEGGEKETGSK